MSLLIVFISLFLSQPAIDNDLVASEHLGKWRYEVLSPDYTYKGIMELSEVDGALGGTINSEGVTITLEDVELENNELSCKLTVQGFPCQVKGTFDGNSFKGNVLVEGMAMPMTASRVE